MWIPDPETVWRGAELFKDYKAGDKELHVVTEDGEVSAGADEERRRGIMIQSYQCPDVIAMDNEEKEDILNIQARL